MKIWQVVGLTGFLVTSLGIGISPVQAQYFGWSPEQREAAQQQRIEQGIASGALTPQEARKLAMEQRRFQAAENRMRADGRFTPQERARLDRMQDRTNRHIYREKHDRQVAYPGYGNHNRQPQPHWQDTHRRPYHPGIGARPQPQRGPYYASRPGSAFPKAASRPHYKERGRFSGMPARDRRLAWGH